MVTTLFAQNRQNPSKSRHTHSSRRTLRRSSAVLSRAACKLLAHEPSSSGATSPSFTCCCSHMARMPGSMTSSTRVGSGMVVGSCGSRSSLFLPPCLGLVITPCRRAVLRCGDGACIAHNTKVTHRTDERVAVCGDGSTHLASRVLVLARGLLPRVVASLELLLSREDRRRRLLHGIEGADAALHGLRCTQWLVGDARLKPATPCARRHAARVAACAALALWLHGSHSRISFDGLKPAEARPPWRRGDEVAGR